MVQQETTNVRCCSKKVCPPLFFKSVRRCHREQKAFKAKVATARKWWRVLQSKIHKAVTFRIEVSNVQQDARKLKSAQRPCQAFSGGKLPRDTKELKEKRMRLKENKVERSRRARLWELCQRST